MLSYSQAVERSGRWRWFVAAIFKVGLGTSLAASLGTALRLCGLCMMKRVMERTV